MMARMIGMTKADRQFQEADAQRVDNGIPKILVRQNNFEIVQANPRRGIQRIDNGVFLNAIVKP